MPIYEYRCESGHVTEHLVQGNPFKESFKAPKKIRCEECGEESTKQTNLKCNFNKPFTEYVDTMITGKEILIKSAKHKREVLKQHGLRQTHDPFY